MPFSIIITNTFNRFHKACVSCSTDLNQCKHEVPSFSEKILMKGLKTKATLKKHEKLKLGWYEMTWHGILIGIPVTKQKLNHLAF